MCEFLADLFGGGDDELTAQYLADAQERADQSLKAQEQAAAQAAASANSASEEARLAEEHRLRKLIGAGAFGATVPMAGLGRASVGTRQLYGA